MAEERTCPEKIVVEEVASGVEVIHFGDQAECARVRVGRGVRIQTVGGVDMIDLETERVSSAVDLVEVLEDVGDQRPVAEAVLKALRPDDEEI